MAGHIKLGAPGDLRDYITEDPRNISRDGANPFTASISTGGAYSSVEGWGEFTMQDWMAGGGQTDPEAGGFLFSTMDARTPGQLILPQATHARFSIGGDETLHFENADCDFYASVGPSGLHGPTLGVSLPPIPVWPAGSTCPLIQGSEIYAYIVGGGVGTTVTAQVYTSAAVPGTPTLLGAGTLVLTNPTQTPRWERIVLTTGGATKWGEDANYRFVVLSFSLNGSVYCAGNFPAGYETVAKSAAGTWSIPAAPFPQDRRACIISPRGNLLNGTASGTVDAMTEFNSTVYAVSNTCLWKWSETNNQWGLITNALPQKATSLCAFNGALYIGQASGNFRTCSTADAIADGGSAGVYFTVGTYLLWKATATGLAYANDGATWDTTPGTVTTAAAPILAIAFMGDNLYFATKEAIAYNAPGDFTVGLRRWSSSDANTIVKMVAFNGSLYIISNNQLYRVDQSHTFMSLDIPRTDNVSLEYSRTLNALAEGLTSLYIGTSGTAGGAVWAWDSAGFHIVATVPQTPTCLLYALRNEAVWTGANLLTWRTRQVSGQINPYMDTSSRYAWSGWFETDKFFGGSNRLLKDFESVFLDIEGSSREKLLTVYWKDEGSTTWEYLGETRDGNPIEFRWIVPYTARPNSHWIRLAIWLRSYTPTITPRIRAVVTSYHPMVNDRYRWPITVVVGDKQQFPDNTINSQTMAQQIAHLDSLIKRVPPFLYQDVDGAQYEVKVEAHSRRLTNDEPIQGTAKSRGYAYALTLVQVNDTAYA